MHNVTIRLEKMVHGGKALGRMDADEKGMRRVVLVRGGMPSELVLCAVEEIRGVWQGKVVEVLEPHPQRNESIPSHPGLDYAHMSYDAQLDLKHEVVFDTLSRSRKNARNINAMPFCSEEIIKPVVPAPEMWNYRHVVQPAYQATSSKLGYRLPESHEIIVLQEDPVAHPAINKSWQLFQKLSKEHNSKGVREVVMRANDAGEVLLGLIASASPKHYLPLAHALFEAGIAGVSYAPYDARGRFRSGSERLAGARSISQKYGEYDITVTPSGFAQPNPKAASQLYTAIADYVAAKVDSEAHVLDLFAGSGLIGFHIAPLVAKVDALEIDKGNVLRGEQAAKAAGLDNVTFWVKDIKKQKTLLPAKVVCINPPRAGIAKPIREKLIATSSAKMLVYVSCDVATWARDVTMFEQAGFRLEHAQPFDFYPQTHHIEMFSVLTR